MKRRTIQVGIEGRVQGVGFRAFIEMNAHELGLDGWVRNRRDGSVEAVFQGASDVVANMLQRCQEGPPASRVTRVAPIGEGVGASWDDVQVGDTLAVVEAMKMENILRAERDGLVKKVNAKPGDSLAVDEVILEFA